MWLARERSERCGFFFALVPPKKHLNPRKVNPRRSLDFCVPCKRTRTVPDRLPRPWPVKKVGVADSANGPMPGLSLFIFPPSEVPRTGRPNPDPWSPVWDPTRAAGVGLGGSGAGQSPESPSHRARLGGDWGRACQSNNPRWCADGAQRGVGSVSVLGCDLEGRSVVSMCGAARQAWCGAACRVVPWRPCKTDCCKGGFF